MAACAAGAVIGDNFASVSRPSMFVAGVE